MMRSLMEQAAELDQAGSPDLAAEKYRAALRLWPDSEIAHYNLALCPQDSGHLGEARRHFAQTLELLSPKDTRHHDVLSRLGQVSAKLALSGTTGGATALAATGAPLMPVQAKQLKRATALLREALTLQPADSASARALGKTLSASGRGTEALEQLQHVLELALDSDV